MNKKLLSMAIAAAIAAPTAAMAEAVLYGKLHMSIDYADVKNAAALPTYDAQGNKTSDGLDFKGWGISGEGDYMPGSGRANRLGVKGSEDLGNGLKAIYQVELGLYPEARDDNILSGNSTVQYRNTFIGLGGGFGTVLVGRHDTPFKISSGKLDMFGDTMADYNGTVGFDDLRVDNAIAYISPNFSGFQFMGALVAPGGATADGNLNVNSDQLNGAWSVAGIYSNGPFYGSLAYESISNEMFMGTGISEAGDSGCYNPDDTYGASCSYVSDDYNKWRLGLGVRDWNGFSFSFIYEDQSDRAAGQTWSNLYQGVPFHNSNGYAYFRQPVDQSMWQIQAGYAFGNNMVKAMYGSLDRDSDGPDLDNFENIDEVFDGDRNTWAIAFDHNLSKRTKAYVLYTAVDDDLEEVVRGQEWSGFSLGMIHKF